MGKPTVQQASVRLGPLCRFAVPVSIRKALGFQPGDSLVDGDHRSAGLFTSMTSALVVERATSLNGGSALYGRLALVAEHTTTYRCSICR